MLTLKNIKGLIAEFDSTGKAWIGLLGRYLHRMLNYVAITYKYFICKNMKVTYIE